MTKFKRGEKVRVKGPIYADGAHYDADDGLTCTVVDKAKLFPGYWNLFHTEFDVLAHEWQIRRLIRKRVSIEKYTESRIKPDAEHGPCGSGPVEHRHETFWQDRYPCLSQIPCPVESCSWGKDKAVPDTATGRKPEDSVRSSAAEVTTDTPGRNIPEWALHKAAQLWCLPAHSHKVMDVEFAQDIARAIAEGKPTPKPAPREFWISKVAESCGAQYVLDHKPSANFEAYIYVREVLPHEEEK